MSKSQQLSANSYQLLTLHEWERAPIDLDANWICRACGKLDMGLTPDPSRMCKGTIATRIEAESKLVEK